MYGARAATIYDAQHRKRGKDYDWEARTVLDAVRSRHPAPRSLLDVACGTGGHFPVFTEAFDDVAGIDVSDPMLQVCRREHPDVPVTVDDMRTFSLGRTFDVVTCLFASIGYMTSRAEMGQAVKTMAAHLNPGGVLAVEPQWFPERFLDGHVSSDVLEHEGATITRASHTHREGDQSVMEVHYVVAGPDTGIDHFHETHRAMLLTQDQYEQAFNDAGLSVDYTPDVMSGRGLFVCVAST